jgi:hypothetical protein
MEVHAWWSTHVDPASGRTYYYNSLTKQSTWKTPALTVKRPQRTVIRKIPLVGTWQLVQLSSGEILYYNESDNESYWTKPEKLTQEEEEYKLKMDAMEQDQVENDDDDDEFEAFEEFEPEPEPAEDKQETDANLEPPLKKQKTEAVPESLSNEEKEKNARVESFKELLRDKGTNRTSTWERIHPLIVSDPRFKLIPDAEERKWIFKAFIKHAAAQDNQQKLEQKKQMLATFKQRLEQLAPNFTATSTFEDFAKEHFPELATTQKNSWGIDYKKLFEDKIKKLFPDVQKQSQNVDDDDDVRVDSEREAELRRAEKRMKVEREQAMQRKALERQREKGAVQLFQTLLAEFVKDSSMNYRESMARMEDDERFKSLQLTERDRQDLFNKHRRQLSSLYHEKFMSLLHDNDEHIELLSRYEDLKDHLKRSDNARFESIPDDRERQRAFSNYTNMKREAAEQQFQSLLKDKDQHTAIFKGIINSDITRETDKEFFDEEMQKVHQMLKLDKRYQTLDAIPETRDFLVDRFVDELIRINKKS